MIVIILLSVAAAGVLSYSSTNYRNSLRQALLDQAKDLAESEMQYLYFSWKTALLQSQTFDTVAAALVTNGVSSSSTGTPITAVSPFPTNLQSLNNATTWTVGRSLTFNAIPNTADGGATGIVPNTKTTGHNYYYSAYTSATITDPVIGSVTFHAGRHFVYSSTSLFQYAIFYQGDLELSAGSNMTINGPLLTNANAYIASQSIDTLVIQDKIYYHNMYNGSPDAYTSGSDLNGIETLSETGATGLIAPIFNPDPTSAAPSDQDAQRALQVVKNDVATSFLGGVNPGADLTEYPDAYKDLTGNPNVNEVYRAVIAPPPTDGNGNLISEDPVVAANRMYNKAGLLITVNQTDPSNPATISVHIGNANNLTAYDSTFAPYLSTIIPSTRLAITDKRENATINVTTLDVGALNTVLTTLAGSMTPGNFEAMYNGVVYMYDTTNGGAGDGILIKNASTTPNFNNSSGNPMGFTVASNNGVYVQGDFNTATITISGTSGQTNPSAILGDAITALSEGWNPANSALPYQNRQATASTTPNAIPAGTDGTLGGLTINAAILTGNTPSNGTISKSGGAQNLVRYLEDWYYPGGVGLDVKLNGSIGQLFTSKYFTGIYVGAMANGDHVYYQPRNRYLNYDSSLASRPPALSPKTTNFSLGDYFFW